MKDNFDVWKEKELKEYLSTTKWRMGNDPKKNKRYYYDKIEKKSQWNKPQEIIEFESILIERYNVYIYDSSQSTATTIDSASTTSIITTNHKTIPTYNECISIINEDDSILNPSIIDTCEVLVEHYHVSFNDVVDMLVKSYKGYPSMIAAVIECIKLAMILKDTSPSELDRYAATTSTNTVSTTSSAITSMDNTTSANHNTTSTCTTTTATINNTTNINPLMDHITVAEIAVDDRRISKTIPSSSSSSTTITTTTTTTVSSEEILAKIVTNIVKQAWKERYYKDAISAMDGDGDNVDGQGHSMPWNHSFMPSYSSSSSTSSSSSSSETSLISYVLSLSKDHLYSNLLLDLYDTYPDDDILKRHCQVGHVEGCNDEDLEYNTDNDDDEDDNDYENDDSNEDADKRKRRKLT
jgi:hypothetical protein